MPALSHRRTAASIAGDNPQECTSSRAASASPIPGASPDQIGTCIVGNGSIHVLLPSPVKWSDSMDEPAPRRRSKFPSLAIAIRRSRVRYAAKSTQNRQIECNLCNLPRPAPRLSATLNSSTSPPRAPNPGAIRGPDCGAGRFGIFVPYGSRTFRTFRNFRPR